jgi:hypothetical protein
MTENKRRHLVILHTMKIAFESKLKPEKGRFAIKVNSAVLEEINKRQIDCRLALQPWKNSRRNK